jgi:hypothetical protein
MWRVAANIFNKQSQTADKGWSSGFGGGRGANNSLQKEKQLLKKCYIESRIWTDFLKRPRQRRIGT